jgi:hypothetical protein
VQICLDPAHGAVRVLFRTPHANAMNGLFLQQHAGTVGKVAAHEQGCGFLRVHACEILRSIVFIVE